MNGMEKSVVYKAIQRLFVFSVEYRASPEHHVVIYRDLIDLSEVIRRRIHVQVSLSST